MGSIHTALTPFTDAQQMAIEHPDTFEAPDRTDLDTIEPGVYVKVCTAGERFWVMTERKLNQHIVGTVANDLCRTEQHGLALGMLVRFEERHVYRVLTRQEMERLRNGQ